MLAVAFSTGSLMLPVFASSPGFGQAPADQAAGGRVAGTVTALAGNVLTVKDDKGVETKVTVSESARVLQLPPGEKSLTAATPIKLQNIEVGDRILAKTTSDTSGATASLVVAMKQSDIAQKKQRDQQEWQTRGISGLVKSVDPSALTVTVTTGNGATAKALIVQASKTTTIRRYAPDSTKFDDARPATLDQIKPGDQLRAKGDKNADGTQLAAEDIVAGTFRNIAGTVISVDPAANTVTVNDLATKKPFQVNINSESQLHKLSPMMAQGIAARLKSASGAPAGAGAGQPAGEGANNHGAGRPAGSGAPPAQQTAATGEAAATPGAGNAQRGGGDMQQMLNRAPSLQLADLKKGDAVMVLTTEGQNSGAATAITLIAGVEPLLQASPGASQSVLSASWNLSGSGGQEAQQ